jgi:hypothetical protein
MRMRMPTHIADAKDIDAIDSAREDAYTQVMAAFKGAILATLARGGRVRSRCGWWHRHGSRRTTRPPRTIRRVRIGLLPT